MQSTSRKLPQLLALLTTCLWAATEAAATFADIQKAGRILVDKSERTLVLFADGRPIRSYPVSLGLNPVGHKRYEGDKRTPEGIYLIDGKNPNSAYHLSLHISYPNERDVRTARERGWDPGGQIMIHGLPTGLIKTSSKFDYDWTDGCIAVSNAAIEEIWQLVDEGTLIEITP
jgi:murein L,D-transpeptidase YafK